QGVVKADAPGFLATADIFERPVFFTHVAQIYDGFELKAKSVAVPAVSRATVRLYGIDPGTEGGQIVKVPAAGDLPTGFQKRIFMKKPESWASHFLAEHAVVR